MSIAIFKEITTEEYLMEIEDQSKKYHEGIYVDMDDAPQRKHIRDSAELISKILKRLDRARIDKKKEYGLQVEKEAELIRLRLEKANSPFTVLIDEWKDKRAKILAEEKRKREAKELAEQIEKDHEFALLLDDQMMCEKHLAEENRIKYEAKLKAEAAEKALADHKSALEREEQKRISEENARLADKENVRAKNNAALSALAAMGVTNEIGKEIVKAIAMRKIPNVYIKY